jgi:hypothetical protein
MRSFVVEEQIPTVPKNMDLQGQIVLHIRTEWGIPGKRGQSVYAVFSDLEACPTCETTR